MKKLINEWRSFIKESKKITPNDYREIYNKEKQVRAYYTREAIPIAKKYGLTVDQCTEDEKCVDEIVDILENAEDYINQYLQTTYFSYDETEQEYEKYSQWSENEREKEKIAEFTNAPPPAPSGQIQAKPPTQATTKQPVKSNYWEEHFRRTCDMAVHVKLVPAQEYNKCYAWMRSNPKKCPSGMRKHHRGGCIPLTQNEKQLLFFKRKIEDWIDNQSQ